VLEKLGRLFWYTVEFGVIRQREGIKVYGSGLSLFRDVVLLPHARARLLLDDAARMSVLARRFAPARCVPLEAGNRIDVVDGAWPSGVRVIEAA